MKLGLICVACIAVIFLLILSVTRGGCANSMQVCIGENCSDAQPYGVFDQEVKKEGVQYKVSVGNVVLSAIFIETIFVPVVLCGWYLWEPVGVR